MTNIQQAKEVMSNLKWSEARDGVDWNLRYEASKKILGLLNGHGDKGLKVVAFRAMNYARKAAV